MSFLPQNNSHPVLTELASSTNCSGSDSAIQLFTSSTIPDKKSIFTSIVPQIPLYPYPLLPAGMHSFTLLNSIHQKTPLFVSCNYYASPCNYSCAFTNFTPFPILSYAPRHQDDGLHNIPDQRGTQDEDNSKILRFVQGYRAIKQIQYLVRIKNA